MPYLGNIPAEAYSQMSYQDLTGGSGTSFTLDYPVGSEGEIEVFVNNVRQEPTVAYTTAGTALTMTGTIAATDDFYVVFQGKTQQTINPGTNSIITSMIQSSAVTDAKIASGITASKLTGALPAIDGSALTGISTDPYPTTIDHFVVTHSGAINNNTLTYPSGSLVSSNNVSLVSSTQITPSVAGRYFIMTVMSAGATTSGGYTPTTYIYKNTSQQFARSGIRNYNGGSTIDFPELSYIIDVNGTTDYIRVAFYQNSGANSSINAGVTVGYRLDQ